MAGSSGSEEQGHHQRIVGYKLVVRSPWLVSDASSRGLQIAADQGEGECRIVDGEKAGWEKTRFGIVIHFDCAACDWSRHGVFLLLAELYIKCHAFPSSVCGVGHIRRIDGAECTMYGVFPRTLGEGREGAYIIRMLSTKIMRIRGILWNCCATPNGARPREQPMV